MQTIGKCSLQVKVCETGISEKAKFIVVPNGKITLLGNDTSEKLAILKIGAYVNKCDMDCGILARMREK